MEQLLRVLYEMLSMLRLSSFVLFVFVLSSCNNQESVNTTIDTTTTPGVSNTENNTSETPNIAGCYLRALQRDTLAASLQQNGNIITGKLTFDNYQKDGSTGTVEGLIENGVVKLVYRFQSEGMNSISELYFKIAGDKLIHGYGNVEVKGDSAFFPDPANISYKDSLLKLPCSELAEKFR